MKIELFRNLLPRRFCCLCGEEVKSERPWSFADWENVQYFCDDCIKMVGQNVVVEVNCDTHHYRMMGNGRFHCHLCGERLVTDKECWQFALGGHKPVLCSDCAVAIAQAYLASISER